MIFILIHIRFVIDINNDEQLKTYGNRRRKNNLIIVGDAV